MQWTLNYSKLKGPKTNFELQNEDQNNLYSKNNTVIFSLFKFNNLIYG